LRRPPRPPHRGASRPLRTGPPPLPFLPRHRRPPFPNAEIASWFLRTDKYYQLATREKLSSFVCGAEAPAGLPRVRECTDGMELVTFQVCEDGS